jgi:cytochrome P450
MLQWFMDAASTNPSRFSDKELAIRVLVLNFASIHTTANSFGHALYHLAVHPEFMQTLRQEVEDLIRKEGWTKAAMSQMRHLDSFFRESTRVTTLNGCKSSHSRIMDRMDTDQCSIVSITRIAMKPFKFSDGTHIPKGTFLGCPTTAVHVDEFNYTHADEFQAFRFVGKASQPAQFAATSSTYIPFGHGKSACPGRFFASVEL